MTCEALSTLFQRAGLPKPREFLGGKLELPCILLLAPKDTPIGSDDGTVANRRQIRVELYTTRVDQKMEAAIRAVLDGDELAYTVERVPLPEERMHETIFEFELIEVRDT